ncbi:MAG: choline/ethanolamine kinase family protein [Chitinophagaceae bacterium]
MTVFFQDPKLNAFITRVPMLSTVTGISLIEGGLTNKNYRINTETLSCVLRVSDSGPNLLGINRENEKINSQRAFEAGVGPAVIDSSIEDGLLLISWINGKTLHANDLRNNSALLRKISASLQKLHAGMAFEGNFHFPSIRKKYLQTVLENNYFIPDKYLAMETLIIALEDALARHPEPLVPCHNDLLAENFMYDGDKIWIIDYEYSGQNEPSFEIGNLVGESRLSEKDITTLCEAYWPQEAPAKLHRVLAWSMIARFGWVAWASIQEAVSRIDFDYRTWGLKKWTSVLPELKSDYYHQILNNIKQR